MQTYKDFLSKQDEFEKDADTKHETSGTIIYWLFLLAGALISAGASYYIGHKGLAGNPFYERFIGASNSALLIVLVLDGTFLALVWGMGTFLKTTEQRALARRALVAIKVILCANILAAFLLIQGASVLPVVTAYTVYGSPLVIGASLWLWSSLYSHRRKGQMMAGALHSIARRDDLWGAQYIADQRRNKEAYDLAQQSPAMVALRNEAARRKAIADVASEFGLTLAEAEQVYAHAERDKTASRPTVAPGAPVAPPQPKPVQVWRGSQRVGQPVGNGLSDWPEQDAGKV